MSRRNSGYFVSHPVKIIINISLTSSFMQRQNLVDLLPVVDAGFEAGGEDHVFEERH